jgi:hypothetical protein
MSTTSPESLDLLERTAVIRALGKTWSETAARLSVCEAELRRLASEHQRHYDRLCRKARNENLREAMDLALATLRKLLDSDDPDISRSAAATLTKYTLARMRQGLDVGGEPIRKPRKLTVRAENVRAENTSESTEVPNGTIVAVRKNVAQSSTTPTPSSPVPGAAPATTTRQTTTASSRPAATGTGNGPIPPDERARRRRLLLNDFAHRRSAPPAKHDRVDQEVARIVDGLLVGGKVDDAPPG